MKRVPPIKPYFPEQDIVAVTEYVRTILESGMLTLGRYVEQFEREFATFCGVKHAIATNSGTSALEIALRSLRLNPTDEVLVPTNTFAASASAVIHAGARVKLVDVDPSTLCATKDSCEKMITEKTRAIILVHIGGLVCPHIYTIKELCQERGLSLIEDAAHAAGSSFDAKLAGSFGDVGCFSFYPTKVITTCEGGIITTNSNEVVETARTLRDQGKALGKENLIVELGHNWRMGEINAAIGLLQLRRLPEIIGKRNKIAGMYNDAFSDLDGVIPQKIPERAVSNFYKYIAFLQDQSHRDFLKSRLRENGVICGGEVYWPPLHLQPFYQKALGVREGEFPNAEKACRTMLCPPLYTSMTEDDIDYVIGTLKKTTSSI